MNAVRRFVLRSTLLRPASLVPILGGLVAGAASWVVGGNLLLSGLAVLGIGGGVIGMIARAAMNVESLTDGALEAQRQGVREAEEHQLDLLAKRLRTDRDHRSQDTLRELRTLREDFEKAATRAEVGSISARMSEQIGQYFQLIVKQLEKSYQLFDRSESVVGPARDQWLQQREEVMADIQKTKETFRTLVNQFVHLRSDDSGAQLSELQAELETNLEIARRTEERMREIELSGNQYESKLSE